MVSNNNTRAGNDVLDSPRSERSRIHDWLDAIGFPFRDNVSVLVASFGLREDRERHEWPVCEPLTKTGNPLLTQIVKPFGFHITDHCSPRDSLEQVYAQVGCGTAKLSLEFACEALAQALGNGTRSSDTSFDWVSGGAQVCLQYWPDDDPAQTKKHASLKGWAQVEIYCDWTWPLTAEETLELATWSPIEDVSFYLHAFRAPPDVRRSQPFPSGFQKTGVGVCEASGSFAGFDDEGIVILPRADLRYVGYDLAHPGRAGGFETMGLHYETTGFHGPVLRKLEFSKIYDDGKHRRSAARIARALDLDFTESQYMNG
jgi:hypothetical protein